MDTDETLCVNKAGHGVAMNNSVAATPGTSTSAAKPTNVNNIHDVQKLQQQLQDIKEQVSVPQFFFLNRKFIKQNCNFRRPCAPFALTVSKIWCSFADMERVRCAAIRSKDAPFAVRQWKNGFCYFKLVDRNDFALICIRNFYQCATRVTLLRIV